MSVNCSPNASNLLASSIALSLFTIASTSSADGPNKGSMDACAPQAARYTVAPSGVTLNALAICHEQQGKTASAWAEYLEASTLAQHEKRPDVVASARQHAAAIEPRLSTLAVRVPPGWDLPGLDVRRDGVGLVRAAWGTAAPVDPGEHRVEVTAPGKQPWHRTIIVRPGSIAVTVEVGPLEDDLAKSTVGTTTLTSAAMPGSAPDAAEARPGSTQRGLGLAIGAVGIASLGVGAYFGIRALDKSDTARSTCPTSPCNDRDAIHTNSQAKGAATVSTVTLAAGGGLFLLGSILFFTAPTKSSAAPPAPAKPKVDVAASPDYAGVRVGGEF